MAMGSHEWEGLTLAGGRYRIIAKLGEGGMGFVYTALDQNIDAEVVIKVPRQAMMDDPEFAGRFTREVRSLVKLSHPHIVKVTDVGCFEQTPFAVMQYLAGGSLEDGRRASPGGRVLTCDPGQVTRWLVSIADALDYIHSQGYVHRDVKPGNILFDTLGHAYLSDFGVAKVLASSANAPRSQTAVTGAGMVLGTPEYMAPELIMGEPYDGRADQYALAITVYEMLCGRRPFEHETKTKVLVLHTSTAPPPLTKWCPALPDRLSQAVLKGLNKDAAERYTSCAELAGAISAAPVANVPHDNRVRLTCSACGKTGSMPASDFAKLKESGRRPTCPTCKTPIELSSALHAAPGAAPSGTTKFSYSGNSGKHTPTSGQVPPHGGTTTALTSLGSSSGAHVSPPVPQPERSGTMALSAPGGQQTAPLIGESTAAPRRGSGTLIERALPRPDEAALTPVFQNLATSEPHRPVSPPPLKPPAKAAATAIPAWTWVAAGAVAGAMALLSVVVLVVSRFSAAETTKSTSGPPAALPATAGSEPKAHADLREQLSQPSVPRRAPVDPPAPKKTKLAAVAETETKPDSSPRTSANDLSDSRDGSASGPSKVHRDNSVSGAQPALLGSSPKVAAVARKAAPARTAFPNGEFDAALLERRPAASSVTLEKLLAAPGLHAGQIVVPAGIYNLAPAEPGRGVGLRNWVATERRVGQKKGTSELEMSLAPFHVIELEPGLASRLEELDIDKWKDRVAILTLWVAGNGACGLVKAEILEKANPTIKKSGYTHKGVVEYETLVVTSEGSRLARGDTEQWEKVGRMNWVAHQFKRKVEAYKRLLRDHEQSIFSAQMNTMFSDMMRNAAVAEQQQRALQQRLTGPR